MPDEIADRIAALYPTVPKLEMFARRKRPGWERDPTSEPIELSFSDDPVSIQAIDEQQPVHRGPATIPVAGLE